MTRRLAAVLVGAVSTVVSLAWAAAPAHAHAVLLTSSPADGASLDQPPTEVLLTFNEPPDSVLSVVRVLDESGEEEQASEAEPVAGQPAQLRVAPGPLAQGTYTVAWRVTSVVDGHTTIGSVAFGVGVPAVATGTDGAQAEVRAPAPTVASVAGRWLFYVGVVLMVGAGVVGAVVVSDPTTVSRPVLGSAWVAGAGGLLLTIADYGASTRASLADLLTSPTGQKLSMQVVAMGIAGVLVVWACRRPSRLSLAAVGVGASAAMLARALAGHANGSSLRWFTVGVQWVHLVSVGAWVGGLLWLLVAMRRGDPGQGPGLIRRFSSIAAATLGVVVGSGVLRALDEVGGWSGLFGTSFGTALLLKLGLFATLVVLGVLSRFRHMPTPARRVGGIRRLIRGEVAIAAGVLGVTAVLTGLPPSVSVATVSDPRPASNLTVLGHDYGTSVRVRLLVTPGSAGPNHFDATVTDYDAGTPVPADTVSLRFQLPDRPEVAAATLDLTRDPDAHWRGSGSVLSIEGRWRITALVQSPTTAVEVPMELVTEGSSPPIPAPGGSCGRGKPDPSYGVVMSFDPDPPTAEGTTFNLTVRQNGQPVTGATVCLEAEMPDMQHPGVSTVARASGAGDYEAQLELPMVGGWAASVTIAEPGKPPVSVSTDFEVK